MTQPTVEPGQEYESYNSRDRATTRIRVLERPVPGPFDEARVWVGTVTPDGRAIRHRYIALWKLHDNPQRRTGYRLVQRADGTPA